MQGTVTKHACSEHPLITCLPPVVCVDLQRVKHATGGVAGDRPVGVKTYTKVLCPRVLDGHVLAEGVPAGATTYDTFAVMVHVGANLQGGHWFANVRRPAGQWYRCSDNRVSLISNDDDDILPLR